MGHTEDVDDLSDLVLPTIAGNRNAAGDLFVAARDYVMEGAHKLAPDLPVDIREEVLPETLILLMEGKGSAYNRLRGTPKAFLGLLVPDAVRRVRANYTPAGMTTRRRGTPKILPMITAAPKNPPPSTYEMAIEIAEDLSVSGIIDQIDAGIDAPRILAMAPPAVARALKMIYYDDMLIGDVALALDVSRFTLHRQLDSFYADARVAA